jgi:hypothetical protein
VTHPATCFFFDAVEDTRCILYPEFRKPVFSFLGLAYLPTQGVDHVLHPVTDAENRNPEIKDTRVHTRTSFLIDAGRASGQYDPFRRQDLDLRGGNGRGLYLAVDMSFPHPPGDELIVLGTKINDHDHLTRLSLFEVKEKMKSEKLITPLFKAQPQNSTCFSDEFFSLNLLQPTYFSPCSQ